jgi:4-amino-4-deoxy-L-arabinose transferase-like glycosyltransferase
MVNSNPGLPVAEERPLIQRRLLIALLILVVIVGAFLRIYPSAKVDSLGVDEAFYRLNVVTLARGGLGSYPTLMRDYVAQQPTFPVAVIPPTRVTFITAGYLWQRVFHQDVLASLRAIACLGSILTLLIGTIFIARAVGLSAALGVAALMSFAPLQIQLAQRAYIDGFFTCWAVLTMWLLWENLQNTKQIRWLLPYGLSLALMVMTKENSVFVFAGVLVIIAFEAWMGERRLQMPLILTTLIGFAIGVLGLIVASGGIMTFVEVYRQNAAKVYATPYVLRTGDGPWFRYILDLIIISPAITLLALAALFRIRTQDAITRYFAVFLAATYIMMTSLRYGMSLRYAVIWDLPIRWLALVQIGYWASLLPTRFRRVFVPGMIALLCAIDLNQYVLHFVQNGTYDPIPGTLLRHLNILK